MQYTPSRADSVSLSDTLSSPVDGERAASASKRSSLPHFTLLDGAMLVSLGVLIACDLAAAVLHAGWLSSALITLGLSALLLVYTLRRDWRPLVGRLLLFGLIAGVLELGTDAAGELVAHSLWYPTREPMLWDSPFYMPLSWMVVLTQIGYLTWRLTSTRP
ncbi:MAG TPA: hypothetical protein VKQ36_04785, partial [Ktedonobacterales bacterium]|nr:hypothetical protein [Ktedonobacterales bacterium]